jgi:hypothetical protein
MNKTILLSVRYLIIYKQDVTDNLFLVELAIRMFTKTLAFLKL